MEPDPGVLCINCEEFIPADYIETHSTSCTSVNHRVITADNGKGLERSSLRIERLQEHIHRQMDNVTKPGDLAYYKILLGLCAKLLSVLGAEQADLNERVAESLSSLIATFRGSQNILLCAERLKSLTAMQKSELDELKLQENKRQVSEIQAQIEFFKARTQKLESALHKVVPQITQELDEVMSDTSTQKSRDSDFSQRSSITDEQMSSPVHEVEDILVDKQARENPLNNLQRYFYSQCLAIKLSIPAKASAQQTPISLLFEEATRLRIPVEGWPEFIRQSLKIVSVESAPKRMRRSAGRKTFRSRLNYCETIVEEEADLDS